MDDDDDDRNVIPPYAFVIISLKCEREKRKSLRSYEICTYIICKLRNENEAKLQHQDKTAKKNNGGMHNVRKLAATRENA